MIEIGNKYNKHNITFVMSTPGRYVDALKKENPVWPIKYGDFMNYAEAPDAASGDKLFWSGYYTSRPDFKKQIKDASAQFYSQSKLYSRMAID
jgi:alpha-mannosidase